MLCENSYPTDIPRRIDVDSMSILHRYVEKKILMNFNAILTYFVQGNFDEQKIDVVLTYLCNVILMSEILASFRCTFFDLISKEEKSKLFRCTFWCNFDVTLAHLFWCDFERQRNVVILISLFDKFLMY